MGILDRIRDSMRSGGVTRSGTSIRLAPYTKPWHTYFTENGGTGWMVLGTKSRRRTVDIEVPYLFPTRAIARSVAKYMTRTAMVRTR